jgi:hypothetical protein
VLSHLQNCFTSLRSVTSWTVGLQTPGDLFLSGDFEILTKLTDGL